MATPIEIVRLKITLDDVKPTVLRRIEVPVSITLDTLHEIIQAIMPRNNSHMHAFYLRRIDGPRWAPPLPDDLDFGPPARNSEQKTVAGVLAEPSFKMLRYTYDFGDDWRHTIKVERRFTTELWDDYPRLVDVKRRCPPDDCGGPWGYSEYLEALSDPGHKRGRELLRWRGPFDPEAVDRAALDTALRQVAIAPSMPQVGSKRPKRAPKSKSA